MRAVRFALLFLLAWLLVTPVVRAQTACPSPDDLPPRLKTGWWARVAHDTPNNLRAEPTTSALIVGQIPAGDIFRVEAGPRCADGYVWWQVNYGGNTAWTAEGSAPLAAYWLEALAGQSDDLPTPAETAAEPEGCQRPPDDYTRVQIGYATLNARTLAMLDHAQALYQAAGGTASFRHALMQGSYNAGGVAASFGTHDGGGALDLSVRSREDYQVLTGEIGLMLRALRQAGFAAWLRDAGELEPGSPIHIHAIAVGDAELSEAARAQIDGPAGYLRGYNGLPEEYGGPLPDTSGGPVICNWMVEMGFSDRREQ